MADVGTAYNALLFVREVTTDSAGSAAPNLLTRLAATDPTIRIMVEGSAARFNGTPQTLLITSTDLWRGLWNSIKQIPAQGVAAAATAAVTAKALGGMGVGAIVSGLGLTGAAIVGGAVTVAGGAGFVVGTVRSKSVV